MDEQKVQEILSQYRIILAPSYTLAKDIQAEATVEAEYGTECVKGSIVTLAHHGSRSGNPAPCNTDVDVLPKGSTILMSHIDLDAVGGVMALVGIKPEDKAFWQAAEYIDVNGPQHTWKLPQSEQDKLNAISAWESQQPSAPRLTEVTDVSETVGKYALALSTLLGERTPEQKQMINTGREWVDRTSKDVEACLLTEDENVRVFMTRENGGPFCCGSYLSPNTGKPARACVQFNPKINRITLSFYDGGVRLSAEKIMQAFYGPKAGGQAGIAGTPRGDDAPKYTEDDALLLAEKVTKMEKAIDRNINFVVPDNDLEAHRIISILQRQGFIEGKNLFVSKQQWGASWDGLEDEIKAAIGKLDPSTVYGVELQGKSPYQNIDHHVYEGDDRSNKLSSLEQVSELIGYHPSVLEQFIAANDKGYIPAMESLAKEKGYDADTARGVWINTVRRMDRAAQGITHEQENQAVKALDNIQHKPGYDVVQLPHSKCTTVTDRLYGRYENLLIVCGDGELDFYGKGDVCRQLHNELGGWAGGDLENSGFWGGYVDANKAEQIIAQAVKVHETITDKPIGRNCIPGTNKIDTSRKTPVTPVPTAGSPKKEDIAL